jgi:hypothetical protein
MASRLLLALAVTYNADARFGFGGRGSFGQPHATQQPTPPPTTPPTPQKPTKGKDFPFGKSAYGTVRELYDQGQAAIESEGGQKVCDQCHQDMKSRGCGSAMGGMCVDDESLHFCSMCMSGVKKDCTAATLDFLAMCPIPDVDLEAAANALLFLQASEQGECISCTRLDLYYTQVWDNATGSLECLCSTTEPVTEPLPMLSVADSTLTRKAATEPPTLFLARSEVPAPTTSSTSKDFPPTPSSNSTSHTSHAAPPTSKATPPTP